MRMLSLLVARFVMPLGARIFKFVEFYD